MLRTVTAIRYVTPLREGGSLPAVIEADDRQLHVVKFRGAGQGPKALIAELLAGEIGRMLGLPIPEIVFAELDAEFWRSEPDPEIQDLLRASAGLNLALAYLPGALARVTESLLEKYRQAENYSAVRDMLARTAARYPEAQKPLIDKWNSGLAQLAGQQMTLAREHLAAGRFREAHAAAEHNDVLPVLVKREADA